MSGILQQVSMLHHAASAAFLRHAGMPQARCRILLLIKENGGCTQKYLTDCTKVNAAAMARQLASMEADGLIRRREDPKSRRRSLVAFTPAGSKLATAVASRRDTFLKSSLAGVSTEDREAAERVLLKMLSNLNVKAATGAAASFGEPAGQDAE